MTQDATRSFLDLSSSKGPSQAEADQSDDSLIERIAPLELAVRVVIPCFNRPSDLDRLLFDLQHQELISDIPVDIRILLVDNASSNPIVHDDNESRFRVGVLRLEENAGGSGGFNAGLTWWMTNEPNVPVGTRREVLYWLLDSDVRLARDALHELLHTAAVIPEAVVIGSALASPLAPDSADPSHTPTPMPRGEDVQDRIFELGGRVSRTNGEYLQPDPARDVKRGMPQIVEYVAACSMLVRQWGVKQAGLMPDVFLNGDDVEWCIRLARVSGGSIVTSPASVAFHPAPDRMRLLDRAYASRNAFAVLETLRLGASVRRRRAVREIGRALSQTLIGRDDLASMHIAGLGLAAFGPRSGRAPEELTVHERPKPLETLSEAIADALRDIDGSPDPVVVHVDLDLPPELRASLMRALHDRGITTRDVQPTFSMGLLVRRFVLGPDSDIAIVSARSRPAGWLCAHTIFGVSPLGWNRSDIGRVNRIVRAIWIVVLGLMVSAKLWIFGARGTVHRPTAPVSPGYRPTVSVIVLSYNRPDTIMHTVQEMRKQLDFANGDELHIVDNASEQPTRVVLREIEAWNDPGIRVQHLPRNLGIGGFNRGVRAAQGDLLLILDDDAVVAPDVLEKSRALLARRTELAAVTLLPVNPHTGRSEWPAAMRLNGPSDRWPFMGCGNLVRQSAWRRVGGYEKAFFLYRNDTDLALKLLALACGKGVTPGSGVHMNPHWTVLHDSKATASKSSRWFETATRNWFWMCRRHGKGISMYVAIAFGWLWAHKLAGFSLKQHAHVQAGVHAGSRRPPSLPPGVNNTGRPVRTMLWVRFVTLVTQVPRRRDPAPKPHRHRRKKRRVKGGRSPRPRATSAKPRASTDPSSRDASSRRTQPSDAHPTPPRKRGLSGSPAFRATKHPKTDTSR